MLAHVPLGFGTRPDRRHRGVQRVNDGTDILSLVLVPSRYLCIGRNFVIIMVKGVPRTSYWQSTGYWHRTNQLKMVCLLHIVHDTLDHSQHYIKSTNNII